jgi:hypothetical protein
VLHFGARSRILGTMRWHPTPKDDAWKQAHLEMVKGLGMRLWLRCDICGHGVTVEPATFAASHRPDMLALPSISTGPTLHEMWRAQSLVPPGAASGVGEDGRAPCQQRVPLGQRQRLRHGSCTSKSPGAGSSLSGQPCLRSSTWSALDGLFHGGAEAGWRRALHAARMSETS